MEANNMERQLTRKELPPTILKALGGFRGRSITLETSETVEVYGLNWDHGSRSRYHVVDLSTGESRLVPGNGHAPWNNPYEGQTLTLLPGFGCIEFRNFAGGMFCTITVHPDNASKLIPDTTGPKLTRDEIIVLYATRSLKNSYGGESNIRYREASYSTDINEERWAYATVRLKRLKLLNKAGAITTAGRNMVPWDSYRSFRDCMKGQD